MYLTRHTQLSNDWIDWQSMTPIDASIRRGYQRFGQYVWNKYEWDRDSWPELFYESDPEKVFSMLTAFIHEKH